MYNLKANILLIFRLTKTLIKVYQYKIRHFFVTIQFSLDDDPAVSEGIKLIPLLNESVKDAYELKIKANKRKKDSIFLNTFPGEHYRLLGGLVKNIEAKTIIDIGTFTGMSSKVFLDNTPQDALVHTFDVIEWQKFDSHLKKIDFKNGRIKQYISDLSQKKEFKKYLELISISDLIFLDAPKDGRFEYRFLNLLSGVKLKQKNRLLIIDDIKFLNMLSLWRSINSPKIDATAFGHWSGTGIVDISNGLKLNKKYFHN